MMMSITHHNPHFVLKCFIFWQDILKMTHIIFRSNLIVLSVSHILHNQTCWNAGAINNNTIKLFLLADFGTGVKSDYLSSSVDLGVEHSRFIRCSYFIPSSKIGYSLERRSPTQLVLIQTPQPKDDFPAQASG